MDRWSRQYPDRVLTRLDITPLTMCNFGLYFRRLGFMANRENASRVDRVFYIASGANNDIFNLTLENLKLILKVGYYDWLTVNRIKAAHAAGATVQQKADLLREDPLNSAAEFSSRVANPMIENGWSPHWVKTYRRMGYCYNVLKHIRQYVNLPPLPAIDGGPITAANEDRARRKQVRADRSRRAKLNDLTIMEKFDFDLNEALANGKIREPWEIEQCLFEVLFTLQMLQAVFPGATHNDLHVGNVFMKKVPEELRLDAASNVCLTRYRYMNKVWKRRLPRYFTAIGDFDFVHVPRRENVNGPLVRNVKVNSGVYRNFGITENTRPCDDIIKFWRSLSNRVLAQLPQFFSQNRSPVCSAIRAYMINHQQPTALELLDLFGPEAVDDNDRGPYAYHFGTEFTEHNSPGFPRNSDVLTRLDTLDVTVLRELLRRIEGESVALNALRSRDQFIRRLRSLWPQPLPNVLLNPVSRPVCRRSARADVEKWSGRRGMNPRDMIPYSRAQLCNMLHGNGPNDGGGDDDDDDDDGGNGGGHLLLPNPNLPLGPPSLPFNGSAPMFANLSLNNILGANAGRENINLRNLPNINLRNLPNIDLANLPNNFRNLPNRGNYPLSNFPNLLGLDNALLGENSRPSRNNVARADNVPLGNLPHNVNLANLPNISNFPNLLGPNNTLLGNPRNRNRSNGNNRRPYFVNLPPSPHQRQATPHADAHHVVQNNVHPFNREGSGF